MILIDDNKTIIAGEALKVMTELALVVDRLMLELDNKDNIGMSYDDLIDRFIKLVYKIKKARRGKTDVLPQEILNENSLKELFPEDFFKVFGNMPNGKSQKRSDRRENEKSSEDMLKEAMAKLNKSKKEMKASKPKKKKNK
jgi:hypothetical protein